MSSADLVDDGMLYDEVVEEVEVEDDEEVEEEVEEEIEEGTEGDTDVVGSSTLTPTSTRKNTPAKLTPVKPATDNAAPGKVVPSKSVKEMQMRTPETPSRSALTPDKNPFPLFGKWSKADMEQVTIEFPILSVKNESTNELTRRNRPESRYWKAPIVFRYGQFTSTTLRFDNVGIPFHSGPSYGDNYIYICLPGHVATAFANAGKTRAPTRVTETSLVPDENRWWKIVNNVESKVGIIDAATKKFMPKSLATIFGATQCGVTASVILSFLCKASTTDTENIKSTTQRTVSVELRRAFIDGTDKQIEMPMRIKSAKKAEPEPAAVRSDVASDELMQRLSALGL